MCIIGKEEEITATFFIVPTRSTLWISAAGTKKTLKLQLNCWALLHGCLNLGGNDAFSVAGNVGWKLKDAAMRCVLRPARKCVKMRLRAPVPAGRSYSAPPDSLAGFGEGDREGGVESNRGEKGTEEEGKKGSGMKTFLFRRLV